MHVLSLPPAFVLSQDQTLRFDKSCSRPLVTVSKHSTRDTFITRPLPARPKPNAQSPASIPANQCKKIQPAQTSHRNPKTAAVRLKPYTLIPKRDNDRSFSHGCLAIGKETDTKLQANNPPPTLLFLLNLQFSKSTPIRSAVGHPDKSGHTPRRVAAKRLSIDDDDGGAKPNRSEQFAPNQFSADRPARPGATAVVDDRHIGDR